MLIINTNTDQTLLTKEELGQTVDFYEEIEDDLPMVILVIASLIKTVSITEKSSFEKVIKVLKTLSEE